MNSPIVPGCAYSVAFVDDSPLHSPATDKAPYFAPNFPGPRAL